MSVFPEVRAILLRRAVGIPGFICARVLITILEWLGDWVSIEHSRFVPDGRYARRPDGGAQLVLPINADQSAEVRCGVHELGHGLLDLPPAERPDADGPVLPRSLAQQLTHLDETECHAFCDALRLPRHLVREYLGCEHPDWDGLSEDSGCTRAEIERRLRWMREYPAPNLTHPPAWAAWHHYRLLEQHSRVMSALIAQPLGCGKEIVLPYRDPREYRALRAQLCGSLAALRPHEFRLKYGPERVSRCDLWVHWDEWRESAALTEDRC